MAIDFMVMPLSRYLSGDFITPTMAFAWEQGVPYSLFGPDGHRKIPKDTPFGGADAPATRARFVPMLLEDLATLPVAVSANLWDEAATSEPTFHRVDPKSYDCLLDEAKGRVTVRGAAHLGAMVFFPLPFEEPFEMPVVFERLAGSAFAALGALEGVAWSQGASSARETLADALRDAVRLRLPMIVDV